jgi:[acyl-carrier-protein] S-malonyltransferase
MVSKFADHLPLYRQSEIYAREGVELERSTLAGMVGGVAALLDPLVTALERHVVSADKLHGDDTPVTVLQRLGLPDEQVEAICKEVSTPEALVIPANYNCPGQLVISGEKSAIEAACAKLKEAGAKRALVLPVSGAFHSPLMQPAKEELEAAIEKATFNKPICPVYQNVDAQAHTCPEEIKANLIQQLTASVLWTKEVQNMIAAGATEFVECGPGKALQGMIAKISRDVTARGL